LLGCLPCLTCGSTGNGAVLTPSSNPQFSGVPFGFSSRPVRATRRYGPARRVHRRLPEWGADIDLDRSPPVHSIVLMRGWRPEVTYRKILNHPEPI